MFNVGDKVIYIGTKYDWLRGKIHEVTHAYAYPLDAKEEIKILGEPCWYDVLEFAAAHHDLDKIKKEKSEGDRLMSFFKASAHDKNPKW